MHAIISNWKNELVDPPMAQARAANIFDRKHADIYAEYQLRLEKAGAMDFDDLLMKTVVLFREHGDVLEHYRQRFEHILVDEYQDTNQAQNEMILMLAGGHQNVCVVGDTDQSVYRFRGRISGTSCSSSPRSPTSPRWCSTRTTAARRRSSTRRTR